MTVFFTGHRQINGVYPTYPKLKDNWLEVWRITTALILNLYNQGHKDFISGGALGFDQIAGFAVCYFKEHGLDVKLWMALPFPGFERKWPRESQLTLGALVGQADQLFYVDDDPTYKPYKLMIRNKWMVDNADFGVALYQPDKTGGTLDCIHCTMINKKNFITINPLTRSVEMYEWNNETNKYDSHIYIITE